MARYGNFNINKKKKRNKPLIAVVCALAAVLIVLFIIGVTAGSDGEEMARMSTAVRENTELKNEVSELTAEIDRLNAEINDLKAQLEAMPTLPPAETLAPGEAPAAEITVTPAPPMSPREGI